MRKLPLTANQQQQRDDKIEVTDRLNSVEKRISMLEAEVTVLQRKK